MPSKRIINVDRDTGEAIEGVTVLVRPKSISPYGQSWMQLNQSAQAEMAKDRDIGSEAWRVFAYLNSCLDFENVIFARQTDIAKALSMKPSAVCRAMRLLINKNIISKGKLNGSYHLNSHYGWKGRVKNLIKSYKHRYRIIAEKAGPDYRNSKIECTNDLEKLS